MNANEPLKILHDRGVRAQCDTDESEELPGPPSKDADDFRDPCASHRRLDRLRGRYRSTTVVVVMAGLAVIITGVVAIILQFVAWVVLV